MLEYYEQFGKVRNIDCHGHNPEVYQRVLAAALPKVRFIIGPKCSGKKTIGKHLAERAGMKLIDFEEELKRIGTNDEEKTTLELIKLLKSEEKTQVIVAGFPKTLKQFETYIANAQVPQAVLFINAEEEICMKNNDELKESTVDSAILMQEVNEYNKKIKPLIDNSKKLGILIQLDNSERISLKSLLEKAAKRIEPEVLIARSNGKSEEQLEGMINDLVRHGGYTHLNAIALRKEEIERRTKIGKEMLDYTKKGKIIPAESTVSMLRKLIYSGSNQQKFVITKFPDEVSQLQLFEDTCCHILWEFYIYPEKEPLFISPSEGTIETYMNLDHRLTVTSSFNIGDLEKYYGRNLQYILIDGPKLSGKTTIAKGIAEKYNYKLIETAGMTEELKKKFATEENPAESINVTFEQLVEFIGESLDKRENRKERYVIDLFPLEIVEQIDVLINALGLPTHFLRLECPIDYIKGRYKILNGAQDLGEDQIAELDKGFAFYEECKVKLEKLKDDVEVQYHEIKTFLSLDKTFQLIDSIFGSKLILLKCEEENNMDKTLEKLAIRYGYLYINTTKLIRKNIIDGTDIGKQLSQTKKAKELKEVYKNSIEVEYGVANYDFNLVLDMLKDAIDKARTKETYILINNLLFSHKLQSIDDRLNARPMDELFMVNKKLGKIFTVISLSKGEYDETKDTAKAEPLPPRPVEKVEEKKELEEGEEEPPAEEVDEEGNF